MAKAAQKKESPGKSNALLRDARSFIRYADYLRHTIEAAPKTTKGERTKDTLKLGAITVLDDVGYHAMRVSDICDAAGVAAATFYLYFDNKEDVTRVVLGEYLDAAIDMMAVQSAEKTNPFATIRASHLKWIEVMYANAGLMRCILQLGDEVEDFRDLAHAANKLWYERVAQSVVRDRGDGAMSSEVALLAVYALGAMMDELARKLLIHPDPALVELKERTVPSNGELADFLAVLWYQAIYGPVPSGTHLGSAARSIANPV